MIKITIEGPQGSGKTTIAKDIADMLLTEDRVILINDHDCAVRSLIDEALCDILIDVKQS